MLVSKEYIAGFFDGEGCITSSLQWVQGKYKKQPRIYIQITVTQKDPRMLYILQEMYGGTIHKKGKGCSHLRITGKYPMKTFLTDIIPFLFYKKEQAILALDFIETIREYDLGCEPLPLFIHKIRLEIHKKLKSLKKY